MHVYPNHVSLVLLAKETKWIYAANWGSFFKVAFLGHDPLMRGGCTCSNPSGSPLFEISCRDIFISSSRIMAVALWHVWSDSSFSHHLFSSFIYLNERYFMSSSMNKDSALETNGEPSRALASLELVPTPPLLPSSVIWTITRGHRLGDSRTLSRIQCTKGPWDQPGLRAWGEI